MILRKLLMLENETELKLIKLSKLKAIAKMWDETVYLACRNLLNNYLEVKKLPLDESIEVIEDVAEKNYLPFKLIAKLK